MGKLRKGHAMKLRNTSRKLKTWIAELFKPAPKYDWLEAHYETLNYTGNDEIETLIARRDKVRAQKKAWRPIQKQLEEARQRQLRGEEA